MEPEVQSNYWMGTWQNVDILPTPELFLSKNRELKYMVYQQEKAPTTGKLHFQCYFEFVKRTRKTTLQKQFPHCYWSKRMGSAKQAIDYCTKLETRVQPPVIWGESVGNCVEIPPDCGIHCTSADKRKRPSELQIVVDKMLRLNMTPLDVARYHPGIFVRHSQGIQKLAVTLQPKRETKTTVIVYYGIPESGKTRRAWELAKEYYREEEIYSYDKISVSSQEWWENYSNQKCVIIDEYGGSILCWERFLKLLDRYPVYVPFKGGSASFVAELVIITSNYPPSSWYPNNDFRALRRRIWQTKEMRLVLDEEGDDGTLVWEPVLCLEEMHLPDEKEHNLWLRNQAIKEHMTMSASQRANFLPDLPLSIIDSSVVEEEILNSQSCDTEYDNVD